MPRDESCKLCPLSGRAKNPCVWGRTVGKSPRIMVIGEAPGETEDRENSAFVGRSGSLLSATLKKAGITDYYVTNVAKCFPKANFPKANPTAAQCKACSLYLDEEISEIRPTHILTLGNVATQRILGYGQIKKIAGKEVRSEKYDTTVVPALHPAAILRAKGGQSAWEAEIMRFGLLTRGELKEKPPVEVSVCSAITDLAWLVEKIDEHCKAGLPISYDVEASYGLDWWHPDYKVWTISFGFSPGQAVVLPLQHPQSIFQEHIPWFFKMVRRSLLDPNGPQRIAHNQVYDDLAIYRVAGYIPKTTWDTMIGWQLIDENSPKGLKWLGRAVLGWPDWGIDTRDLGSEPLESVAFYNGCDAAATVALYHEEVKRLEEMPRVLRYFQDVPQRGVRAVERIMANGVHVNRDTLRERTKYAIEKSREISVEIPVENVNSTKQLAEWLYGKPDPKVSPIVRDQSRRGGLGLPVLKRTPTGVPSTDEDVVKRLARWSPQVRKIVEYRRWNGSISRYFKKWADYLNSIDGRAHFEYRVGNGADTGRLSGFIHTTPRDPFERNCMDAPEGWTLVSADLSQIEARLAAWAAAGKPKTWKELDNDRGRKTMLWAFHEGRDTYIEMAAEALGKPESEVTRDKSDPQNDRQVMGKVPTLASLYEITPQGLQRYGWEEHEIEWTIQQATHLWQSFRRKWPEFPMWHARERRIITTNGWTQSVIGRVRRLPEALGTNYKEVSDAVRTGINMPVQSLASDIVMMALAILAENEDHNRYRVVIHHHDALILEVKNEWLDWMRGNLEAIMTGSYRMLEHLGLQLPDGLVKVEVSTGAWGGKWKI